MANINLVRQILDTVGNKNQNGQFTTVRYNIAAQSVSIQWMNNNIGQPEIERNGMSPNDMFYEADKKITDNIIHLVTPVELPINAQGRVIQPSDWVYVSSVRYRISDLQPDGTYRVREVKCDPVDDGQLAERLNSELIYPTTEHPIYNIKNDYLQLYPMTSGKAIYTYLRMPQTLNWAYTIQNGQQVYDAANSTDFDFPDSNVNEIAYRMAVLLGINIDKQSLLAFANDMVQKGS